MGGRAAGNGGGVGESRARNGWTRVPWGSEWDRSKCNSACFWAKKDIPDQNALRKWRAAEGKGLKTGTMKVGSFPAGASPYGALDMVGNVWEWTSSMCKDYAYDAQDGREDPSDAGSHRVMRGGSWYRIGANCRANLAPTRCVSDVGVRLCVVVGRVPARAASGAAVPDALRVPQDSLASGALALTAGKSYTNKKAGKEGFVSLFNGKDLTGWVGATQGYVARRAGFSPPSWRSPQGGGLKPTLHGNTDGLLRRDTRQVGLKSFDRGRAQAAHR